MSFLCIDFVNSSWYITHKLYCDPMLDEKWLIKLAVNWGMNQLPKPTETEIALLIEMRSNLSALFCKMLNSEELTATDLETTNDYMMSMSYHRKLEKCAGEIQLRVMPNFTDWNWFISEVAASFAEICTTGAAARLKVCENPECGWFFIDKSKSGTKKWCDDTCASRMKVRRFRQKQKREKGNSL